MAVALAVTLRAALSGQCQCPRAAATGLGPSTQQPGSWAEWVELREAAEQDWVETHILRNVTDLDPPPPRDDMVLLLIIQ